MSRGEGADPYAGLTAHNWTPVYERAYDYAGEAAALAAALAVAGHRPPARVFERGCGTGSLAIELARRGFAVDAVDQSHSMAAKARERTAQEPLISIFDEDPEVDPGTYAGYVMQRVAPSVEEVEAIVAHAAQVLAPGGLGMLAIWDRREIDNWLAPGQSVTLDLNADEGSVHLCSWTVGEELDAMDVFDLCQIDGRVYAKLQRLDLPFVDLTWAEEKMRAFGFEQVGPAPEGLGVTLVGRVYGGR